MKLYLVLVEEECCEGRPVRAFRSKVGAQRFIESVKATNVRLAAQWKVARKKGYEGIPTNPISGTKVGEGLCVSRSTIDFD